MRNKFSLLLLLLKFGSSKVLNATNSILCTIKFFIKQFEEV